MNRTPTFLHPHLDLSVKPVDARAKMEPNLPWADCYSVGFRISTQSHDSFVHAMIFADSFERLLYGIDQEKETLRTLPSEQPVLNIDVVYLRSMQTLDTEYLPQADRDEIEDLTRAHLKKRDDNHFVVFGIIGETTLALMDVYTTDAKTAVTVVRQKRIDAPPQEFTVLEVRQAHPASKWFETMFREAARRMSAIEDRDTHWSGQLH
ncbi:hypothetical protein [Sideroxyarcus sp. TK5]